MKRNQSAFDQYASLAWSPDGKRIAYVAKRHRESSCETICSVNVETEDVQPIWDGEVGKDHCNWHSDLSWPAKTTTYVLQCESD